MNKKERERLLKLHSSKYRRHFTSEGYFCFYCGAPANTLDHVPPLHHMDNISYETRKKQKIPCVLLPCCIECNSKLGAKHLLTVDERLAHLELQYDKIFKKQKSMWTQEEIDELGFSLKGAVIERQNKLERYIDKIRAIHVRMILFDTHPKWTDDDEHEPEGV
jgi:hypothetical protein